MEILPSEGLTVMKSSVLHSYGFTVCDTVKNLIFCCILLGCTGQVRVQFSLKVSRFQDAAERLEITVHYSHSIVAGGLELTSYVTRLIPRTSLIIRLETFLSKA